MAALPSVLERPAFVIVSAREDVACEWCSLDGAAYVRIVKGSDYPATDEVSLCDDCARELVAAIHRRLRRERKKKP